ncbi:uncharacterized protein BXIN_0877 [Babesia sp. Xinjiang]|uniref:uncharacterized protein n=1 Tax=Babesia sp. Xinjiang TaxID=462227 RepID=UPI000A2279DC|nr:uncharacterized protein BXIN_0877 [Babesia sp. Xinjiang]ORM41255.1 hypothetical protein BXIN_0877 [Babesia sp. Xinjiang]
MGGRLSTKRCAFHSRGDKESIFESLLQFPRLKITDESDQELEEWMKRLFFTPIDNVAYEAIEIYIKNFVIDKLLKVNLKHGHMYRYWERFTILLEHVLRCDKSEENDDYMEQQSHISETGSNIDMQIAIDKDLEHLQGQTSDDLDTKDVPLPTAAFYELKPKRSSSRVEPPLSKMDSVIHIDQEDATLLGLYERVRQGKCAITRCLTLFVISRMLMKCLMDSVNAVELLFHMDYVPCYLEWSYKATFKLNAEDGINLVTDDPQNYMTYGSQDTNLWHSSSSKTYSAFESKSYEHLAGSGEDGSYVMPGSGRSAEAPIRQKAKDKMEINRTVRLRFPVEENTINTVITAGSTLKSIEETIVNGAMLEWSESSIKALHQGFCFIDHNMHIFSLKSFEVTVFERKGVSEFMIIPLCTIDYGGSGYPSRLRRLLLALFSYTTANITAKSALHDTFLKATQSMVSDVLILLLSSIVLAPYLNTYPGPPKMVELPPMFSWVTEIPKSTKSVAPYYYIHMDYLRWQLFCDVPGRVDPIALQYIIGYYYKKQASMKYCTMETLRLGIGDLGPVATVKCLIRIFSANSEIGCKRHLLNLRNHATLLFLILIGAKERGDALYLDDKTNTHQQNYSSTIGTTQNIPPSRLASILEEAGVDVPDVIRNQQTSPMSAMYAKWLKENIPSQLMATLAKALKNVNASKICTNELWLVLISVLSNDKSFTLTFYAKPGLFIKEVINTMKRQSAMSGEYGKFDPYHNMEPVSTNITVTRSTSLNTLTNILIHYVVQEKVTGLFIETHNIQENCVEESTFDIDHIVSAAISAFEW